ncbi:MAG: hypothetical protein PHO76_02590 [Methylotenera sp.]|nr:hypothetical protein [Methylotenera sp.]MDD4927231.1 hypothetical protein [Methylotenera sp.]
MGLFGGSTKQSGSNASGLSQSGLGAFAPSNRIYLDKPLVDLTNPYEVAALGGLGLLAWWAWRKFK